MQTHFYKCKQALGTKKPGSRKGRPNHSPEFRRRIAINCRVRARCFSHQTGPQAWSRMRVWRSPGGTGIVPSKERQRQRCGQ
ncbi:MAG: hypothetical protein VB142_08310 [Burkholderia sp.]